MQSTEHVQFDSHVLLLGRILFRNKGTARALSILREDEMLSFRERVFGMAKRICALHLQNAELDCWWPSKNNSDTYRRRSGPRHARLDLVAV